MASSGGTALLCLWVVFCCSNSVFLCSLSLSLSSSLSMLSLSPYTLSPLLSLFPLCVWPSPLLLSSPFLLFPPSPFVGLFSLHQVSKWLYWWSLSNLRYGQFLQYVHFFFLSVCLCLTVCLLRSCMLKMRWLHAVCVSLCASLHSLLCLHSVFCWFGSSVTWKSQLTDEKWSQGKRFIVFFRGKICWDRSSNCSTVGERPKPMQM